jgi:gluconokinase
MVVVLMGVAGCGKTTVGKRLAAVLGWEFHDADALHAEEALAAMAGGRALTDAERRPWLRRLSALVAALLREDRDAVLACSALTREARALLRVDPSKVQLVHLVVSPQTLAARLSQRTGHFFPGTLLDTQLATLQPAEDALEVDAEAPADVVVERILSLLPSV